MLSPLIFLNTTVLGPLLFLTDIDDIVENLSLEMCLFTDDCLLYTQIRCLLTMQWCKRTLILFTIGPTSDRWTSLPTNSTLGISRENTLVTSSFGRVCLLLNVDSYSYLGVIISSDMRWNIHVHHISTRATRALNPLRKNIPVVTN